jgi:hypothetical protein
MTFKSCNHPIEIYISSFPLRLFCILIRLAKLLIVKKHHTHQNHAINDHAMHIMEINPNIMEINPSIMGVTSNIKEINPSIMGVCTFSVHMRMLHALKQYTFHFMNHVFNTCFLYKNINNSTCHFLNNLHNFNLSLYTHSKTILIFH